MLRQQRGVRRVGRETAAEIHLPALATEHLLVGRQDDDATVGPDVDLGARAREPVAGDPLLDDAASGEVVAIPVRQRLDLFAEPSARIGSHRHRPEVDHRVAVAGAAVVVLDHDPGASVMGRPERLDGLDHVVGGAHVLGRPQGTGTPARRMSRRPSLLKPRWRSLRPCSVDRHAERERQPDLHLGDVPALDQGRPAADDAADLLDPLRVIEQLRGDRADGPVIDVDEGQPRPERVADRGRRRATRSSRRWPGRARGSRCTRRDSR